MTELAFYLLFWTLDGATVLIFCWVRIWIIFKVIPMFGGEMLPALGRNLVTLSISLPLVPAVSLTLNDASDRNFFWFVSIVSKEAFIGYIMGHTIALVFWAIGGIGFFIDNQRGASMASSMNPMLGDQASPIGTFLTQTLVTILFATGAMLVAVDGIYASFVFWSPVEFFPTLNINSTKFFLGQFDDLMMLIFLLGAPLVACMFLAEFGLGLVGRFAPQLNVFFLAMPIKSGVALAVLLFYLPVIIVQLYEHFLSFRHIAEMIDPIFK